MDDSPMSYDMLRSLAVQVSQELYREAEAQYAPSGPSFRDAFIWLRARLANEKKRLHSDWANLAQTGSSVQHIHS